MKPITQRKYFAIAFRQQVELADFAPSHLQAEQCRPVLTKQAYVSVAEPGFRQCFTLLTRSTFFCHLPPTHCSRQIWKFWFTKMKDLTSGGRKYRPFRFARALW